MTQRETFRDITIDDVGWSLQYLTNDKLTNLFDRYLAIERTSDVDTVAGLPTHFSSVLFHSERAQVYHRHCLYQLLREFELSVFDMEKLMAGFYEVLAKGLVYKEMKRKTVVFVHPKLGYYVKDVFVSGRGFTAILLQIIPGSRQHEKIEIPSYIMCISGSNFHPSGLDAASCYKTDLESYIGKEAFESSTEWLSEVTNHVDGNESKMVVCGHSLGGALAQMVTAKYPNLVEKCIVYNGPGVPKIFHDALRSRSIILPIEFHVTIGDVVWQAGGYHLGYQNTDVKPVFHLYTIDKTFYFNRHTYICISNPKGYSVSVVKSTDPSIYKSLHNAPLEFVRWGCSLTNALFFGLMRSFSRTFVSSRVENYKRDGNLLSPWEE